EEHVHGIREERQPDDDRERAPHEDQVETHGRQRADAGGHQEFHAHAGPSPPSGTGWRARDSASREACSARSSVRDSVASDRRQVPTTTRNTPMSKTIAEASSTSPNSGRWKYPKVLVRKGLANNSAPRPVAPATSTPPPISTCASKRARLRAQV